jgi:anti-sigma regulatory factor (Ser/Thr protein kinase)
MKKPMGLVTRYPGTPRKVRRIVEAGILLLLTLAAALVTLYARLVMRRGPFPINDLHFDFNPVALGVAIQWLIVPLVLVYLFSSTPFFRRIVGGEVKPHDRLGLAGVLVSILLISLICDVNLSTPDRTVFGAFVIIIGGLLGGWRLGLALGLIGMFVSGMFAYLFDVHGGGLAIAMRGVPQVVTDAKFWVNLLTGLGTDLVLFYVINLRASMSVWIGIAAGFLGNWLNERWLVPAIAFTLGAAVDFSAGVFILLTAQAPVEFLTILIASALLTGLGLGGFALIVRSVQAEVARRKATEAELALARAELRALRAQIKPHFLFNALNTIRYFVRTDPETARQLLLNLSEIFQRAIRSGEFVSLRDELSCVQAYLSLEQARLGERLRVTWAGQVAEPQRLHEIESPLLDQMVPTLSVQPIVENAVIHGISKKPEGGSICTTVEQIGKDICIRVEDDGKGIEPGTLAKILQPAVDGDKSIGLRNVDGRLRALYGQDYGLAIQSQVGQGTRVTIKIPVGRN